MVALPDLVDETRFFPVLQRLQECLCAELAKSGGPTLCYCGLMVGDAAPLGFMNCKDGAGCGVAWVRPVQAYPSAAFPDPDPAATCNSPLAMQIEIGVARCYPRPQGREVNVDPQRMFEAARLYMSDMQAVRRAVNCCFGKERTLQHVMSLWEPIPAGAGISGGSWTIYVG